jgi:GAF domain-containing protein
LPKPFVALTEAARKVAEGDLVFRASVATGDERQDLAEAMTAMTDRLRETVTTLEERVQERTAEVEQRSRMIEAAAEVGRAAASILDADQLMRIVVEKIRESFNLYYVGLFLLDETQNWVVLRAGTGEAGQKMLARGHRRKVGEGMIGWSVTNNQARVASEVAEDLQRVSSSELPETRSEAALPLRSRGQVIGALTVQSSQLNAFDAQTVSALQTMADQVAIALDNARLFAESRTALEAFERTNLQLSQSAWSDLLQKRGQVAYRADDTGVSAAAPFVDTASQSSTELAIPIQVRGVVLGHILAQKPVGSPAWNEGEKSLVLSLVEQLSVALDNARLYTSTQQSAARERVVSEITARVRASTNVNMIMQTAVQELAQALRIPVTSIQLRPSREVTTVTDESAEQASTARDEL